MKREHRLRVLVVDDDDSLRRTVCDFMRRDDTVSITEASDATEAMSIVGARANLIDAVFTDVAFPEGPDGFYLADWLHKQHPEIAIAVASGYVRLAVARTQLPENIAFVEKPYDVKELVSLLHGMVRDHQNQMAINAL